MLKVQLRRGGPITEMDEAQLQKKTAVVDNANEHTISVEYCLAGCDGAAHQTDEPDAPSSFCSRHVHRSAHVTLKRVPSAISEIAGFR